MRPVTGRSHGTASCRAVGSGRPKHHSSAIPFAGVWPSALRFLAAAIGLAWLGLLVVAGLVGSPDSSRNPANYLARLYFWPGVAIVVALVGNLWRYLNPWRRLGSMLLRVDLDQLEPIHRGIWPAVAAFGGFVWFDLASGLSNRPRALASAALHRLPAPAASLCRHRLVAPR